MRIPEFFLWGVIFLCSFVLDSPGLAQLQDDELPIPLQLVDVMVRPGRPFVLSVRTCQPRGVSQGEILLRDFDEPLTPVRKKHVFSQEGDAIVRVEFPQANELLTVMASPSGTINAMHGPLMALLLRAPLDAVPGRVDSFSIDPTRTSFTDASGNPAGFRTFGATLTVIDESAPFTLAVDSFSASPAHATTLVLRTFEFERLRSATYVIRYDPSVLVATLNTIVWDFRGDAGGVIDQSEPGVLRVTLDSPSNSVNLLPGPQVEIEFQVSSRAVPGRTSIVDFDEVETILRNGEGDTLELDFIPAVFTVLPHGAGG